MGNRRMASYGAFRGGQQRLTLQSEAVAALRGEDFENRIIMDHFTEFRARTSALFWEYCKPHATRTAYSCHPPASVVRLSGQVLALYHPPAVWRLSGVLVVRRQVRRCEFLHRLAARLARLRASDDHRPRSLAAEV